MFTIHKESPEEMQSTTRIDWPFKDLTIGETVEIKSEQSDLFKKARVAAHALASHNGWKFTTKIGENGSLYIQRTK